MIIKDYQENYGSGWVKIYRSLLNNRLWTAQKFTRGQAWIDLLLLAKYKGGIFYVRDVLIEYLRGDITEGVINLSKRWKWSRGKTQNFLDYLEKNEQQIRQQKLGVITLITITNYDQYQQNGQQNEQQDDNRMTIERQQDDTHKKDKNVKNDKKYLYTSKSLEERMTEFELAVMEYKGEYPKEMLQAFWEYWSEPNYSRTKMKKELQKTWDTKRRLKTWANNSKQFNKTETQTPIRHVDDTKKTREMLDKLNTPKEEIWKPTK